MTPYLDSIARSLVPVLDSEDSDGGMGTCGRWASLAMCEGGHLFARSILCGREWCEDCGKKDSDSHKRRVSRWLPKLQQLSSVGYLVVTFPPDFRAQMRTQEELSRIASRVTHALKSLGYDRGLRRWHWFGECPTHGKKEQDEQPCNCIRGYHPHLNFLLDSGKLSKQELRKLKAAINHAVGRKVVQHYQWTDIPGKMYHLLKYVTRPTFLDRGWDNALADSLHGFRTTWSWGKWKGEAAWILDKTDAETDAITLCLESHVCPHCATPINWTKGVIASSYLTLFTTVLHHKRYWELIPQEPP